MLTTKSIVNNKILCFLRFRSLFFSNNILCFFMTTKTKMSDIDKLKNSLVELNLNFEFFNNNFTKLDILSNLNSYFSSFQGSFFVISLNSFFDLSKLKIDDSFMLACYYRSYFLNNYFFSNLDSYYKFFCMNYLFIISFLIFFTKTYLNIIFYIKILFLGQIKLRIQQLSNKNG